MYGPISHHPSSNYLQFSSSTQVPTVYGHNLCSLLVINLLKITKLPISLMYYSLATCERVVLEIKNVVHVNDMLELLKTGLLREGISCT
jgi:hypothetical protein